MQGTSFNKRIQTKHQNKLTFIFTNFYINTKNHPSLCLPKCKQFASQLLLM